MEFVVNRKSMMKALADVGPAVPSRTQLPILETVLVKASKRWIEITATDLDLSIQRKVTKEFTTRKNGTAAIQARLLRKALRAIPDEDVTFTLGYGCCTVQGESISLAIPTMEPENFPDVELQVEDQEDLRLDLPANVIDDVVKRWASFASKDETRPVLNGLYFEITSVDAPDPTLWVVGTDGHRMAVQGYVLEGVLNSKPLQAILTPRTLRALGGADDVISARFLPSHAMFEFKREGVPVKVSMRLIEGPYVDYRQVCPDPKKATCSILLDRGAVLEALNVASITMSAQTKRVRVEVQGTTATFSSRSGGSGASSSVRVPCAVDGTLDGPVALNVNYLAALVKACRSEEVDMRIASRVEAILVQPATEEEIGGVVLRDPVRLLMPLREDDDDDGPTVSTTEGKEAPEDEEPEDLKEDDDGEAFGSDDESADDYDEEPSESYDEEPSDDEYEGELTEDAELVDA